MTLVVFLIVGAGASRCRKNLHCFDLGNIYADVTCCNPYHYKDGEICGRESAALLLIPREDT